MTMPFTMTYNNPYDNALGRQNLHLNISEPVLFPSSTGKRKKQRNVNENLAGYVFSPRNNASHGVLPPIVSVRSPRQVNGYRRLGSQVPRTFGHQVPRSTRSGPEHLSDDVLPPLRFHASLHHGNVFGTTKKNRNSNFANDDVNTGRFYDDTFKIFRPMLYSVLMTQRILPRLRKERRRTCIEDNALEHIEENTSSRNFSEQHCEISSDNCGASPLEDHRTDLSEDQHIAKDDHQSYTEDKQQGYCQDDRDSLNESVTMKLDGSVEDQRGEFTEERPKDRSTPNTHYAINENHGSQSKIIVSSSLASRSLEIGSSSPDKSELSLADSARGSDSAVALRSDSAGREERTAQFVHSVTDTVSE